MQLEYDKLYLIFIPASSMETGNLTALISLRRGRLKPLNKHLYLHFFSIKFNHVLSITLLLPFVLNVIFLINGLTERACYHNVINDISQTLALGHCMGEALSNLV